VWCIGRRPCYGLAAFLIPAIPERQGLNMDITLYIDNLNVSTTEEELKTLFMQAGEVTSITINKDRGSGESKGFGFLAMSAQSEADQAVSTFNSYSLNGHKLKVRLSRPLRNAMERRIVKE
jgi:RNA recognition motif-containing protein